MSGLTKGGPSIPEPHSHPRPRGIEGTGGKGWKLPPPCAKPPRASTGCCNELRTFLIQLSVRPSSPHLQERQACSSTRNVSVVPAVERLTVVSQLCGTGEPQQLSRAMDKGFSYLRRSFPFQTSLLESRMETLKGIQNTARENLCTWFIVGVAWFSWLSMFVLGDGLTSNTSAAQHSHRNETVSKGLLTHSRWLSEHANGSETALFSKAAQLNRVVGNKEKASALSQNNLSNYHVHGQHCERPQVSCSNSSLLEIEYRIEGVLGSGCSSYIVLTKERSTGTEGVVKVPHHQRCHRARNVPLSQVKHLLKGIQSQEFLIDAGFRACNCPHIMQLEGTACHMGQTVAIMA